MPAPGQIPHPVRDGPSVWGSGSEWNVENAEGNKAVHIWRVLLQLLRSAGLRQQQGNAAVPSCGCQCCCCQHFLESWEWASCDLSEELLVRVVLQEARSSCQIAILMTPKTNNLTSVYLNFSVLRSGEHLCCFLSDLKWGLFWILKILGCFTTVLNSILH